MNSSTHKFGAADAPEPVEAGPPSSAEPIDELIEHQRVVSMYQQAPQAVIAGLVYCPLFAWALSDANSRWPVALWLALRTLVGLLRLWDIGQFLRAVPPPSQTAHWRRRGLGCLAVDAISWAAVAPLFLTSTTGMRQSLVLVTIFAVAAIGAMTLFARLTAVALFTASLLLPTIALLALRNDLTGWAGAAGGTLFLAVLLLHTARAKARWIELQRLRFENAKIALDSRRLMLLAEHASATKSRFLATVSHELRTPLNGILGTTQMMQLQPQDAATQTQLETIARSAKHLRQMIGDLVDLSRIETGKLRVQSIPFHLSTAIDDVVTLQQAAAGKKSLAFNVDRAPSLPAWVHGDVGRLKQVLHNLIGNAVKFTDRGSVWLNIEYSSPHLKFTVNDTGHGVAPDRAEQIFDAFEQGEGRYGGSGLGLGLTISRELARAMGGDLQWIERAAPGASFVFTLPAPVAEPEAAGSATPLPRFSGRALLVDDNPVNAEVTRAMLQHLGLQVELAGDGRAALQRLAIRPFDLVLMDVEMPVLDGLEATRQWRAIERDNQVVAALPIVAVTANAVQGDRERCLAAGMNDYLAKPFELPELAAMLGRVWPMY